MTNKLVNIKKYIQDKQPVFTQNVSTNNNSLDNEIGLVNKKTLFFSRNNNSWTKHSFKIVSIAKQQNKQRKIGEKRDE